MAVRPATLEQKWKHVTVRRSLQPSRAQQLELGGSGAGRRTSLREQSEVELVGLSSRTACLVDPQLSHCAITCRRLAAPSDLSLLLSCRRRIRQPN